jgi:hypothetical protein
MNTYIRIGKTETCPKGITNTCFLIQQHHTVNKKGKQIAVSRLSSRDQPASTGTAASASSRTP